MANITHGVLGRVLSALSYIVLIITSAQQGGVFDLIPPKWAAILTIVAASITVFAERVQGGASLPKVRQEAAKADMDKAIAKSAKKLAKPRKDGAI